MTTIAEVNDLAGPLAELLKQVKAGNEVLLTQGNRPVARLVPASKEGLLPTSPLRFRSLAGHRVLTPLISQTELADELFGHQ